MEDHISENILISTETEFLPLYDETEQIKTICAILS